MVMQGLTLKSLKRHIFLIPLFSCVGFGCVGSIAYLLRLALKSPKVSWARSSNPEPWEHYRARQYKLYSPGIDYSKLESAAPKY